MICVETIDVDAPQTCDRPLGKRSRVHTFTERGRYSRALPFRPGERFSGLAVDASVRAALGRRAIHAPLSPFSIELQDLRKKQRVSPGKTLITLVVDASDSMGQGTFIRMKAAKGAALAMLAKARLRRYRIGMVAFREKGATVLLPPTQSVALARGRLQSLPTGGATPLADGLMAAWKMIRLGRIRDPLIRPVMVLISDGEANVPLSGSTPPVDVFEELRLVCEKMASDGIHSILIDTKPKSGGEKQMRILTKWLQGVYYHIDRLKAGHVVRFVSQMDC